MTCRAENPTRPMCSAGRCYRCGAYLSDTGRCPTADKPVTLRYTFRGGIFTNERGQLHEEHVPNVEGAIVWFAYTVDPLTESVTEAKEAADEIARWLVEDRGAKSVGFVL